MTTQTISAVSLRQKEIVNQYLAHMDEHISDLKNGVVDRTLEIRDFAELMHIHPTHLSNTIAEVLGKSPCAIYEQKLMAISRELLLESGLSVATIARQLTYDPSNFTKFFKHYEGVTPKQFREMNAQQI